MAFQNITFPDLKLKHGLVKTVVDPVVITGNGAREVRRRQNQFERFVWSIQSRNLTEADKLAIHAFLRGVNIAQDSFLYRDPTWPTFTDVRLPQGTGTGAGVSQRQLCFPYAVPNVSNILDNRLKHPIYNLSLTGLTFKNNGVTAAASSFGVLDDGHQYVTVTGATNGSNVTVTGTPKLVVRFNGQLGWAIAAMTLPSGGACGDVVPSVVQLADFQLVEVFEQ